MRGGQKPHPDAGCFKCNRCRVACPILNETKKFKSTNTKKEYKIKQKVTCDSDWVIYLGTCTKCEGQYVGKSQTSFKRRHSNHKQEVKKKVGGLGHHYGGRGGCGYQKCSVQIIEQLNSGGRINCRFMFKMVTKPSLQERNHTRAQSSNFQIWKI